jgi:hypothetical protein
MPSQFLPGRLAVSISARLAVQLVGSINAIHAIIIVVNRSNNKQGHLAKVFF